MVLADGCRPISGRGSCAECLMTNVPPSFSRFFPPSSWPHHPLAGSLLLALRLLFLLVLLFFLLMPVSVELGNLGSIGDVKRIHIVFVNQASLYCCTDAAGSFITYATLLAVFNTKSLMEIPHKFMIAWFARGVYGLPALRNSYSNVL